MKSFLKEIEDKFIDLDEYCESCDTPKSQCTCNEDIDEQNTTGAVAGYNTPAAFAKPGKWKRKNARYESVNEDVGPVSKIYKPGHYQVPEFDEEVQNDKFPFAIDDAVWLNKDMEYPSKNMTDTPGTANKKDYDAQTKKTKSKPKITVEDVLEKKYEQLIEGYRSFATGDANITPERKVKNTIQEIAKKLQEIEKLVQYNSQLKTEAGIASSNYGPATSKALTKISERLIKISERVRSLGE